MCSTVNPFSIGFELETAGLHPLVSSPFCLKLIVSPFTAVVQLAKSLAQPSIASGPLACARRWQPLAIM